MTRTIKLRYEPIAGFAEVLADQRRRQGRLIRSAYQGLVAGMAKRDLYAALRAHPVGQGLHTWLTLSGIRKASALFSRHPNGKVVFGGRRALLERAQGRMSRQEWRSARLMPLYVEGHAKSYGAQGGNHLVTLDIVSERVIYHGPDGRDFPIKLCLSRKSREYRRYRASPDGSLPAGRNSLRVPRHKAASAWRFATPRDSSCLGHGQGRLASRRIPPCRRDGAKTVRWPFSFRRE